MFSEGIKWNYLVVVFCIISVKTHVSAIYTVNMRARCGEIESMNGIESARLLAGSSSFQSRTFHCTLTLKADAGHRLMIQFKGLRMKSSGLCSTDWLNLFDGGSIAAISVVDYKFCGYTSSSAIYTTSRNLATFYFHGNINMQKANFSAIVTQFHTGPCDSNEITCNNGRCVDNRLPCDGYNPCGDHSDCPNATDDGKIVGVAVGAAVFMLILMSVAVCVVRRRKFNVLI